VAEALVAAGQQEQAEQVARAITDPDRQAEALARVVEALAAGQEERAGHLGVDAEQVARSLTDPDQQAAALAEVAAAWAKREGNSAQARSRRIVAEILASNLWYQAMPVLTSLDPKITISIGTAILNI
jgi:hypothetical protein